MNLLYFTIIIPLLAFIFLATLGRHWSKENIAVVGVSAIGIVIMLLGFVCVDFYQNQQADKILIYIQPLWQWFSVGKLNVSITLLLDGLALTFLSCVVVIALLVNIFTLSTLDHRDAYTFYAYGSLMVACMALLLLADNLLAMLLGWEGITLCSYLLVGFNHKQFRSSYAAVRTFVTMHISDIFLLLGLFLLYSECQTMNIRVLLVQVSEQLAAGSDVIWWVTTMLFIGVIGKTAQLPMQLWMTDTAVAPMPAMTLISSASTMLAGIYLILRLNSLFIMNSDIFPLMGYVASFTLLYAGCSALVQNDLKKLVAYAVLCQFSYVFLAIAIQAWQFALVYLISYTVLSALLLLTAAAIIKVCHGERNIAKLGSLIRYNSQVYSTLVIAGIVLGALPWVTVTFYVKGDILWGLVTNNHLGFAAIGLIGLLLSILYIFRLIFVIWLNRARPLDEAGKLNGYHYFALMSLTLILVVALLILPAPPIEGIVPHFDLEESGRLPFQLLLAAITILGILIAYIVYGTKNTEWQEIANSPLARTVTQFWYSGWCLEQLYNLLIIKPYLWITQRLWRDPLSIWNNWIPRWVKRIGNKLTFIEDGHLRWYIASIVMGGIAILMLLIFYLG